MEPPKPNRKPRNTRSWKNLLINRKYQLRFTLFMVGLAALLMAGLGMWVMKEADEATTIGKASVAGIACPKVPDLAQPDSLDGDSGEPTAIGSGAGKRRVVVIDESSLTTTIPKDFPALVIANWRCETTNAASIRALDRGRSYIVLELIATGVVLIIGLAIYGLVMTHRVAGPLYKLSLYFAKMRDGRYETIHNLRKRDQLVAFYDHFRAAHGGVVQMERDDIVHIQAMLAAAEAAGATDHEAIVELRALLQRKEKSLE